MNSTNQEQAAPQVIQISGVERWTIYRRLQELHIPCQCSAHEPLQVELHSTNAAIQLWSVLRQVSASRDELLDYLKRCWQY